MKKTKIISGLLLVFFSGLCVGAVGGYVYTQHKIESLVKSGPPPEMLPRLMRRLSRELALTPSEQAELKPITRDMMTALSDLRHRYHPELERIMTDHFSRMKEKLPAEKGRKLAAVRERLKRWGRESGPPRPPRRAGAERTIALLRQELDLTPEQMLRLRTLFRDRLRRGTESAGLDPEGPAAGAAWPELETDLRRILTPEQMAAYRRLKAEGKGRPREPADSPDPSSPARE